MTIAVITALYPPDGGGAEQATAMFVRGAVALGHKVVVYTAVQGSAVAGEAVMYLSPRRPFPHGHMSRQARPAQLLWHLAEQFDRFTVERLESELKMLKPALIVTGNVTGLGAFLPRMINRLRLPHIHVVHDVQPLEPSGLAEVDAQGNVRFTSLGRRLWQWWSRFCWQSPTVVVFPSAWLKAACESRGMFPRSRRVVVRNPVAGLVSRPGQTHRTLAAPQLRLLFVGHLEPHKGIEALVRAIQILPDQDIRLDVVGDGSLRLSLERTHADPRIHFHGRLHGEQLDVRYQATDALVFPSRVAENAPLVIVDALARHVPVIAAPVGGVPELVVPGQTGWLALPGTPAFAEALAALRNEKNQPTLGWQQAIGTHTPETYAAALLQEIR